MIDKEILMREYFQNEKTYKEIAIEQKCGITTVHKSMRHYGLIPRTSQGIPLTKDLLLKLYVVENKVITQIAKETHWSVSQIKKQLETFNIPRRSSKKSLKHDYSGQKIGLLTVQKHISRKGWICLCDCGNVTTVRSSELNRGCNRSISCGCNQYPSGSNNHHWRGCGELSASKFNSYKSGAKDRNLDFTISIEYAWKLFLLQKRTCALSGVILTMDGTASLDRIDSTTGYIEGNMQWVHKEINLMKWDLTEHTFISWCHQVANHNPLK